MGLLDSSSAIAGSVLAYARRAGVSVTYNSKNITEDIAKYLVQMSYTDNLHGKSDDIELQLSDRDGRWSSSWAPSKGDAVEVSLLPEYWSGNPRFRCGAFIVDEISYSSPPSMVTIRAASSSAHSGIRQTKKTRSWEKAKFSQIASDIAKDNGSELLLMSGFDPLFERKDQRDMSDAKFLQGLCEQLGYAMKIHDGRIIVFSEKAFAEKDPVLTIEKNDKFLKQFAMETKAHDVYDVCLVTYHDPKKSENITYRYEPKERAKSGGEGKILVVNKVVHSQAEAIEVAKAALYKKNKYETSGSLTLAGSTRLCSGLVVALKGFGFFDGKYFIERAVHSEGQEYTTAIELRTSAAASTEAAATDESEE